MVLRPDRGTGGRAAQGAGALAGAARRALRHDPVGDRPARGRRATATDRHPPAARERARLRPPRRPRAALGRLVRVPLSCTVLIAVVAAGTLAVAGCGESKGSDRLSREDYLKKADAVCAAFDHRLEELPEP